MLRYERLALRIESSSNQDPLSPPTHTLANSTFSPQIYRAMIKLHHLPSDVDHAFLGDQRVMQQWINENHKISSIEGKRIAPPYKQLLRGIVVPAGGIDQLANAFANLYVLRHHLKCTLPVTLSYWGNSTRERISSSMMHFFHSHIHDLSFLDLSTEAPYPSHHRWLGPPHLDARLNGFKVKVFALYSAPYDEVLLMDSDSMALLDPSALFELSEYKQHGTIFWPDRWCTPVKLFTALGMQDDGGAVPQTDSGQLLFDRHRHATALDWLLFLNTHDEFTYRYAHGDKDTFRAAFYLDGTLDTSYYQVNQPLSNAMLQGGLFGSFMSRGFLQHHPNGSLAFIHRTSRAKYGAKDTSGRAFNTILSQPHCRWSERYWHFFTPMIRRRASTWQPLQGSYVQQAQTVADIAHGMFVLQQQQQAEETHVEGSRYHGMMLLLPIVSCLVLAVFMWWVLTGRRRRIYLQ